MPYVRDAETGDWREYTNNAGEGYKEGGLYNNFESDVRLQDAAERRAAGLTGTILSAPTFTTTPEIAANAARIAAMLAQNPNVNNVDSMYATSGARYAQLGAAGNNPLTYGQTQPTGVASYGVGPNGQVTQLAAAPNSGMKLMGPAGGSAESNLGSINTSTPMGQQFNPTLDMAAITERARALVDPQYATKQLALQQQIGSYTNAADTARQNTEASYTNALGDFQLESQNLADTVTGNMGRSGLFGSGIHQQDLIDKAVKYGLPQKLAALSQQKAMGLSNIDRELLTQKSNASQMVSQLQNEQAAAIAQQIAAQQESEYNKQFEQYKLAQEIGARRAEVERQIGKEATDRLYDTANMTGTIPEGLTGAGQLTAAERNRVAQLAISQQNANRLASGGGSAPAPVDRQKQMRDQMYVFLDNGMAPKDLPAVYQAEYDRIYGTQGGLPKPSGGVTENAILTETNKRLQAKGIFPGDDSYGDAFAAEYANVKGQIGRGGNVTSPQTNTAAPSSAPPQPASGLSDKEIQDMLDALDRR